MVFKLRWAAIVLLWFAATPASAQSYHLLTVDDFQGMPQKMSFAAVAYTNCSISYNYGVKRYNGNYRIDFNVSLVMNKNISWLDRSRVKSPEMMAEILKHEQGHYAIAYLQQQEILRTFGRTRFGRDYAIVIKDIFDRIDRKYKSMNDAYEAETNHMQNREQQVSWDRYIARSLEYMPPLTASN